MLRVTDFNSKGTKYFGGHSDLLCGILIVKTHVEWMSVRRLLDSVIIYFITR